MIERKLQDRIRLAISENTAAIMFRNNVGFDPVRKIHFGLCVGSSDLIGWTSKTITPNMVGGKVAIFTAIEIKTKTTRLSLKQHNFITEVKIAGGIAGVARSEAEAIKIIT